MVSLGIIVFFAVFIPTNGLPYETTFEVTFNRTIQIEPHLKPILDHAIMRNKSVEVVANCSSPVSIVFENNHSSVLESDASRLNEDLLLSPFWVQYLGSSSLFRLNVTSEANISTICKFVFSLRDPYRFSNILPNPNKINVHQKREEWKVYTSIWFNKAPEDNVTIFIKTKGFPESTRFSFGKCGFLSPTIREEDLKEGKSVDMLNELAYLACPKERLISVSVYIYADEDISGSFQLKRSDDFDFNENWVGLILAVVVISCLISWHHKSLLKGIRRFFGCEKRKVVFDAPKSKTWESSIGMLMLSSPNEH